MAKAASANPRPGVRAGEKRDEPKATPNVPSPFPLRLPQKPPRPTRRRLAAGPPPGSAGGFPDEPALPASTDPASAAALEAPAIARADEPAPGALAASTGVAAPPTAGDDGSALAAADDVPAVAALAPLSGAADLQSFAGTTAGDEGSALAAADDVPAVAALAPLSGAADESAGEDVPAVAALAPLAGPTGESAATGSASVTGPASPAPDPVRPPSAAPAPWSGQTAWSGADAISSVVGPVRSVPRSSLRQRPAPPVVRGWPAQGFGVTTRSSPRQAPAPAPADPNRPVVKVSMELAAAAAGRLPATATARPETLALRPPTPRPAPRAAAPQPTPTAAATPVATPRSSVSGTATPVATPRSSVSGTATPIATPRSSGSGTAAPVATPRPAPPVSAVPVAPAMTTSAAPAFAPSASPATGPVPRPTRSVPFPTTARRDTDDAPVIRTPGKKPRAAPAEPLPPLRLPAAGARLVAIEDLAVPACAARVQASVARIPGVEEAEASAGTGVLAVRPASVDDAALREAVAAAGHRLEVGDAVGALRRPLIAAGLAAGAGVLAWATRAVTGSPAAAAPVAAASIAAAWPVVGPVIRHALRGRLAPDLLPLASSLVILVATVAGADVRPEAAAAPLVVHLLAVAASAALRSRARAAVDRLAAAVPAGAGPKVGSRLELPPGATVPADARLLAGALVDETALGGGTADRVAGETVIAGTVLPEGGTVEVVAPAERSLARRALAVARRAEATGADAGRFGLVARTFPFTVLAVALAAGIFEGPGAAAAVLAAATPLALAAAVPLALATGLGRAVSRGAAPRSVEALLRAGRLDAMVFDRTSGVARGAAAVTDFVTRPGADAIETLRLAAAAEAGVDHPIARALARHAADVDLALPAAREVRSTAGRGIRARVGDRDVAVGSGPHLAALGIELGPLAQTADELAGRGRTPVLVAVDGVAVAVAGVADSPRDTSRRALGRLELRGLDVYVAGGDAVPALKWLARVLGLETAAARGDLAPEGKRELVAKVKAVGATAMVAGAAADAPALAAADLGIAVDGSPEAEAAAGAILVRPDPAAIADLVEAGWATRVAATAAGGLAVAGNVLGLALAGLGAVGPVGGAALALVTSALALAAAGVLSLRPGLEPATPERGEAA